VRTFFSQICLVLRTFFGFDNLPYSGKVLRKKACANNFPIVDCSLLPRKRPEFRRENFRE